MTYREILSIDPPPSSVPMYTDASMRTMSVAWVRWFQNMWERVGGSAGDLIYDAADASTMAANLIPQISAVRSELGQELSNNTLFAINQAAANKTDTPPSISLSIGQTESSFPFSNFAAAAMAANASRTLTLDEVLNNGNTSSLDLSTGAHVILTGNLQTNGLSAPYGTTSGTATGGVNVVQGTGASATWLLSGTSAGTFRAGIQVLDAGGALRVYEGANHFDFAAGAITFPGALTAGNSTLGTIGSGAITSSANITANGGTVKAAGAANTQITLANSANSQIWNFAYNSTSLVAGIYDTNAGAFRIRILDTTGETQFPANIASTTTTTGTVVVTGGVGVSGQVTAGTFKGNGAALTNLPVAAPNYQEFVSTAAQTVFNTTINTTAKAAGKAYLQVYISGVFQQEGATKQFTVTGANQLTFNVGLAAGLDVVMFSYS